MTGNKKSQFLPLSKIRQSSKKLTSNEAEGDYKGFPLISFLIIMFIVSQYILKTQLTLSYPLISISRYYIHFHNLMKCSQ